MSFQDLLNQPLPSKVGVKAPIDTPFTEGYDEDIDGFEEERCGEERCGEERCGEERCGEERCGEEACSGAECESDDIDLDDIDPDELSDDELAKLDSDLFCYDLDDDDDEEDDDDDDDEEDDDDENEEVKLSPSEEIKADDMMSVAATTMLVNDELNAEERAAFIESEAMTAIEEGFITESDVTEMSSEIGLVTEANNYNKKMIIRLDAAAKKKQLYALAVNVSAAAKRDPDYIKLKKVMKMRKILRAKLDRKYHNEAMKRMKIYFNRLRRSKSPQLSKIGNKYSK